MNTILTSSLTPVKTVAFGSATDKFKGFVSGLKTKANRGESSDTFKSGQNTSGEPTKKKLLTKELPPKGYKVAATRKSKGFKVGTGLIALLAGAGSMAQLEGRTNLFGTKSQVESIETIQAQFADFENRAEVIKEAAFLSETDTGELTKGLRSDFYFAMHTILKATEEHGDVTTNEGDFEELLSLLDDGALTTEEIDITNQILKNAIENDSIGDYKTVFNEWYEDVAENRLISVREQAELRREVQTVLQELEDREQFGERADTVTDVSALLAAVFLTASVLPSKKLKKLESEKAAGNA